MQKQHLPHLLNTIQKPWNPLLVANLNNSHDIKIAKIQGEFIWHAHPDTDELFYILSGTLIMYMEEVSSSSSHPGKAGDVSGSGTDTEKGNSEIGEDTEPKEENVRIVELEKGDVFVVPKGIRHKPTTGPEGAEIMMMEKVGTVNTGDVSGSGRTVDAVDVR